jgi:hypothetical protein
MLLPRVQQTLGRSACWLCRLLRLTRTPRQRWFRQWLPLPSTNLLTLSMIKTAAAEL